MASRPAGTGGTPLEIAVEHHEDTASLLLSGELDLSCKEQLDEGYQRIMRNGDVHKLILDVRRLQFAVGGPDLLHSLCERARQDDLDLILMRAPSELRRELERGGLHRLLPIAYELSEPGAQG